MTNKTIVIDRSRWARGRNPDDPFKQNYLLCKESGMMCCLGFAMCQIDGYSPERIRGNATPINIAYFLDPGETSFLFDVSEEGTFMNSSLATIAMDINDHPYITEEEREEKLDNLFASYGYIMQFIN